MFIVQYIYIWYEDFFGGGSGVGGWFLRIHNVLNVYVLCVGGCLLYV